MPFKSQAQRRKFYAMADRGEISKETVKRWEDHTGDKKLPERVKQALDPRLVGTLFGAGAGGLIGYARDSGEENDLRNTLIGAGAGGALGFGAGALMHGASVREAARKLARKREAEEEARRWAEVMTFPPVKLSSDRQGLAFLEELGAICGTAHGWRETPGRVKQALDPRIPATLLGAGVGGLAGYSTGDSPVRNTLIGAGLGGALGFGAGTIWRHGQQAEKALQADQARVAAEQAAAKADRAQRAGELVRSKQQQAAERMQQKLNDQLRGMLDRGTRAETRAAELAQSRQANAARMQRINQESQQKMDAMSRSHRQQTSALDAEAAQRSQSFDKQKEKVDDLIAAIRRGENPTFEF